MRRSWDSLLILLNVTCANNSELNFDEELSRNAPKSAAKRSDDPMQLLKTNLQNFEKMWDEFSSMTNHTDPFTRPLKESLKFLEGLQNYAIKNNRGDK